MKKIIGIIIFINYLMISFAIGQNEFQSDYLKAGVGIRSITLGDVFVGELKVEYIMPFNQRLNFGMASNFGYRTLRRSGGISPDQRNVTKLLVLHVDPSIYLRMASIGKFSIYTGVGMSAIYIRAIERVTFSDVLFRLTDEQTFSFGGSVILQFNYAFNKKTGLALKMITQPYINRDIATGISLSFIKTFNKKTND